MESPIVLIPASEKKQQLAAAASDPVVVHGLKKTLAGAIAASAEMPFILNDDTRDQVYSAMPSVLDELSVWLRQAGYCLIICYNNTGNGEYVSHALMGYYEDRGDSREEAITAREIRGNCPPDYY